MTTGPWYWQPLARPGDRTNKQRKLARLRRQKRRLRAKALSARSLLAVHRAEPHALHRP